MKKERRIRALAVGVAIGFLFPVFSAAWADTKPSHFKPQINNLNAVVNELRSVNKRLQDALTTLPAKVASVPKGILGKLGAMTNQLQEIDRRLGNILSSLPQNPATFLSDGGLALRNVQEWSQNISNLAGNGFLTKPADPRLLDALSDIKTAAQGIFNGVIAYVYTGYQELQTLHYVNIFVMPTCNDDGSMCGQVAIDRVKSIMDGTNALMYRSESSVRVRPKLSYVPEALNNTTYNSDCHLYPGIKILNTAIDGGNAEVLGWHFCGSSPQSCQDVIIDSGDYNKDTLCIPWTEEEASEAGWVGLFIQETNQAALAFVRNGTKAVEWDSVHHVWRHYRINYSASSSMGFGLALKNQMGDAGGNGFSHELGHYLGNQHTHWGNNFDSSVTIDQLKQGIIDARNALCPSQPLSCDPAAVVDRAFNRDDQYKLSGADLSKWWNSYNQAAFALDDLPITDTPADPGIDAWTLINGDRSLYGLYCMTLNINGKIYFICPDRTNIMSYFSDYFPLEAHFSTIQKDRAELSVTELHRIPVTESLAKKTWRNKTKINIADATYLYQPSNPVDLNNIPLKWTTSKILVEHGKGAVNRALVGISINQIVGGGGLHIELIDPHGTTHTLQQPSDNDPRILETIRNQYYIDTKIKNGLWTLRVAEQPNYGMINSQGFISDWQLQFETP